MKLHLPCRLLASVLACICMTCSYTMAAETISVNYVEGDAGKVATQSGTLLGVDASTWNDIQLADSAVTRTDEVTSTSGTTYTLTTNTGRGTWHTDVDPNASLEARLLSDYIDLSNSGGEGTWSFSIKTDYLFSELRVYLSNDSTNGGFSPITINDKHYLVGTNNVTTDTSDVSDNHDNRNATAVSGNNTVVVTLNTDGGSITAQNVANSGARAGLSGFQIIDKTADVLWVAAGDISISSDVEFSRGTGESVAYSTLADMPAGDSNLGFSDQKVTFSEDTTVDAVYATSGTVSIDTADNTTLTVGKLVTAKGVTLELAEGAQVNSTKGVIMNEASTLKLTGSYSTALQLNGNARVVDAKSSGQTINNLNAAGCTATFTQGTDEGSSTFTFTGDAIAGTVEAGSNTTVKFDKDAGLTAYNVGGLTLGENSKAYIHVNSGTPTTSLGNVTMAEGANLYVHDGYVSVNTLTLTGDVKFTQNWNDGVTISKIDGVGHTLTTDINLTLNGGELSEIGTLNLGKVTLSLASAASKLEAQTINIEGGGKIVLKNGNWAGGTFGVAGGTINISNAESSAVVIQGGYNGNTTNILSNIVGEGKSKLTLQKIDNTWQNLVTISGIISGDDLSIVQDNGRYKFTNTNTYGGGTTIKGGATDYDGAYNGITAAAEGTLGSGKVTLVGDGRLTLEAAQTNAISFTTEQTGGTLVEHASLTASGESGFSYNDGSITGKSMTGTTINNGALEIMAGETLTFTEVTMTGDTVITLNTLGATTFSTDVTSGALSGITLTGNLDLSLSSELVSAYASEDPFSITLTGLNSSAAGNITVSDEMLASFGALESVTKGESATVLTFAGTGAAVPEPTTATLSLLALAALAARRRRK